MLTGTLARALSSARFCNAFLLASAFALSGCSNTPVAENAAPEQALVTPATTEQALVDIASMTPGRAARSALDWADDYLAEGRLAAARLMVESVRPQNLSRDTLLDWARLKSLLHLSDQQADEALAVLDLPRVQDALDDASPEEAAKLTLLRADALTLNGRLEESLRERTRVDADLPPAQQRYNQDMIWTQLMMMPLGQLESLDASVRSGPLEAWLELAMLYRDPLSDIDTQMQRLNAWRERWPGHAAAANLPDIVAALETAVQERPRAIAVLLPLSGPLEPAGKAIRDGMLTAYYSALEQGYPVPGISFYDTVGADLVGLYNQALDAGAELIIGPLEKEHVNLLARIDRLPVPTLSLNYSESTETPARNLFQFGLAPEDEARQVAAQALAEGIRLAAILHPPGEWGKRVAETFRARFEAGGGLVTTTQAFSNDATGSTRALLNIGQSHARARELQRYTSLPIQFEPRRRKDIDIVFLVADNAAAQQLKPALDFNYASDLPVFAISSVYGGTPSPSTDADLNGIRFVEVPWLLGDDSRLHRNAEEVWPEGHGRYERLFALGVDAYRLHARLRMLHAVPESFLPGVTGQLSVDSDRRLVRELQWAWFVRGKPKRMPVVVNRDENRSHGPAVAAPAIR